MHETAQSWHFDTTLLTSQLAVKAIPTTISEHFEPIADIDLAE